MMSHDDVMMTSSYRTNSSGVFAHGGNSTSPIRSPFCRVPKSNLREERKNLPLLSHDDVIKDKEEASL